MDGFIHITAIALIIGYAAFSVWFICKRQTVWGSVGSSAGLLCGGVFIVSVAEAIASFIWRLSRTIHINSCVSRRYDELPYDQQLACFQTIK